MDEKAEDLIDFNFAHAKSHALEPMWAFSFGALTAIMLGRVNTGGMIKEPTGGIDREGRR
jgi:hypothetical protein